MGGGVCYLVFMITQSQSFLNSLATLDKELNKAQAQLETINQVVEQLNLERDYLEKQYNEAYAEELASRRNRAFETLPPLKSPNAVPSAQWAPWKAISERVTKVWSKQVSYKHHMLLSRLSYFAQEMMAITNTQAWNPRNPNPHLP